MFTQIPMRASVSPTPHLQLLRLRPYFKSFPFFLMGILNAFTQNVTHEINQIIFSDNTENQKRGFLFLDADLIICHQSEILENWFLFPTGETVTRLSAFSLCYFFHSFQFFSAGMCWAGIWSHFCSLDEAKLNTVFTLLHRKLSSKPFQSLCLKGEKMWSNAERAFCGHQPQKPQRSIMELWVMLMWNNEESLIDQTDAVLLTL